MGEGPARGLPRVLEPLTRGRRRERIAARAVEAEAPAAGRALPRLGVVERVSEPRDGRAGGYVELWNKTSTGHVVADGVMFERL